MRRVLPAAAALAVLAVPAPPAAAAGVKATAARVGGVPVHVVRVDLRDPAICLDVGLANDAPRANTAAESFGDEPFEKLVGRARAAVVINGTFFSKDAQKRVMGNMVRGGRAVKFSPWENAGTTFGLLPGNRPELVTAQVDGKPDQDRYWLSVTAGPRLLRGGEPAIDPGREGFHDPHVLGAAGRSALGFGPDGRTLVLASFGAAVTLAQEALAMKALGCAEAMNLDGGASRALALGGRVLVPAGRPLTNVLAVYDARWPAPAAKRRAFRAFGRPAPAAAPQAAATPAAPKPPGTRAAEVLEGFGAWLLRGGEKKR